MQRSNRRYRASEEVPTAFPSARYSLQDGHRVPWRYIGELLPVRVTENELLVYNAQMEVVAKHALLSDRTSGLAQADPAHASPRSQRVQVEQLQRRFAELCDVALRFLEGLLWRQRYPFLLCLLPRHPAPGTVGCRIQAFRISPATDDEGW
jgi:hypothetical protein